MCGKTFERLWIAFKEGEKRRTRKKQKNTNRNTYTKEHRLLRYLRHVPWDLWFGGPEGFLVADHRNSEDGFYIYPPLRLKKSKAICFCMQLFLILALFLVAFLLCSGPVHLILEHTSWGQGRDMFRLFFCVHSGRNIRQLFPRLVFFSKTLWVFGSATPLGKPHRARCVGVSMRVYCWCCCCCFSCSRSSLLVEWSKCVQCFYSPSKTKKHTPNEEVARMPEKTVWKFVW